MLVEEPSMEEALRHLLPKIIGNRAGWKVINMGSKGRLMKELPNRLRGYKQRMDKGEKIKIIVLIDRDNDNCHDLKRQLEDMARKAGLQTKTAAGTGGAAFQVVNRIAIEELEAWFMGDTAALQCAFTSLRGVRFPNSFNNPDNDGTWERLHHFLKQNGIYRKSYPKIDAARTIAKHMDPGRNRSRSFQYFVQGVEACL
ncbi:MAG TPA: DUF4276 domain-containing protein [Chlorobaculum sp.]|uniref:DUF4276 family protein n=1 Tax=Chlorobaculum tepidum (strain ATCC 49652 / DSM 12025 / NBRC 103806 / TLS) TaxID=194439 RepID=Q8KDY4_CHLTE|nr:hypothetical protein CT0910 [Chlorobaculum tepidum TLS]HBU23127.1 DUF4276 domain-containing protein [Chlorobaculum sp.]